MKQEKRKIEVTAPVKPDELEIQHAQDFGRILTRFDAAKKPLTERRLFQYKQRWFFLAILLLILLLLLILGIF